jgi:Ca-activated chloride channel family protein
MGLRHSVVFVGSMVVVGGAVAQQGGQIPSWARNVVVPQARVMVSARSEPFRIEPVRMTEVRAGVVVVERVATVTLDISLQNPSPQRQEAELLVPVPAGSSVRGFAFEGPAAEPTARLLPHGEARATYEATVAKLRDPALLEFLGHDLVRSSVFPVEGRSSQKVRLTYEHLLLADRFRVDFVLPRSETAADPAVRWSVAVKVRSARTVSAVYSPSHEVEQQRLGPHEVAVRLAGGGPMQPGPFRLSWMLDESPFAATVLAYPDPSVGGGYLLLLASLPERPDERRLAIPRELTLVLDRSGSMRDGRLDQVRAAAVRMLEQLGPGESFNLVAYDQAVEVFSPGAVPVSRTTVDQAKEWLEGLEPRGGTNLHDALVEALRQPSTRGALLVVLLLTDGLPTVGETGEAAIRDLVTTANPAGRRVFTLGVGEDVNTPLLEGIAADSRAFATFVLPGEDLGDKLARVFSSLQGPRLADLELEAVDGMGVAAPGRLRDLEPARLPDLFGGDQLVLLGRYRGEEPFALRLAGTSGGSRRTFRVEVALHGASTANGFVPRLWASRRIAALVSAIRAAGGHEWASGPGRAPAVPAHLAELVDEVVRLSTEFGVLTEYTAFLAEEGTDLGRRDQVLAQAQGELMRRAVQTRSGLGAVNQELNLGQQRRQKVVNKGNAYLDAALERQSVNAVQQVADLAFFHRAGRWVDSRILMGKASPRPQRVVEVGSPGHLDVAARLQAEGRQAVLALPGDVVTLVDGSPVLIRGTGN